MAGRKRPVVWSHGGRIAYGTAAPERNIIGKKIRFASGGAVRMSRAALPTKRPSGTKAKKPARATTAREVIGPAIGMRQIAFAVPSWMAKVATRSARATIP